ncbi:MAG: transporter substrate-binding domain-containing protein [Burkholderiales bacterium]|nr:transporter substrate-binding domain-containing protein [Burkholderiales bacterium]
MRRALAGLLLCAGTLAAQAAPDAAKAQAAKRALSLEAITRPSVGDFDAMRERRLIRVLVPYSRTLFFYDGGEPHGLIADLLHDFETWLNQRHRKALGKRPITVVPIPVTRDRLIAGVVQGYGDIAAGNLTITPEREAVVDFSPTGLSGVFELVVSGPASPPVRALLDLAGEEVHVRRSSSYHASLVALNRRFVEARKPKVRIRLVPESLEDEDLMEMVSAGLIGLVVVDDWKAKLWAGILDGLEVHGDIAVREGGRIGWAYRKGSPGLAREIDAFVAEGLKGGRAAEARLASHAQRIQRLQNNVASVAWRRFESTFDLFRKYGLQYGFDPLMLAAQGFQESRLDQAARSPAGAVGVMQLLPSTGRAMQVGDIHELEPNIHAGIKYMNRLLEHYFKGAHFDPQNRMLFALASYNAGPSRIAGLRERAARAGLDPNRWFGHVEQLAAERIGHEPVRYVRNIYKYYVAYRHRLAVLEARRDAAGRLRLRSGE